MKDQDLKMWTIYWNPKDYPELYVVRKFFVAGGIVTPGAVGAVTKNLDVARASIPPECVRISPEPNDDQVIVESWI